MDSFGEPGFIRFSVTLDHAPSISVRAGRSAPPQISRKLYPNLSAYRVFLL